MEAARHIAEEERIEALRSYQILDTPREPEYDEIVSVVSAICDVPISVVNLIDRERQWFKAETGLGVRETPLPASICAHAILQRDLFIVPDTLKDERFCDNPLVTGEPKLRFYAGALLETPEGLPLGTICVLDYKPRNLNEKQKALLRLMAGQIMKLFELRRQSAKEKEARERAESLLAENETLAQEADHRIMNSLQLVASMLAIQKRNMGAEAKEQIEAAERRVQAIATVHRHLLLKGGVEFVEIGSFLRNLCGSLTESASTLVRDITVQADDSEVTPDVASAIGLIIAELIANSTKHAFPDGRGGTIAVTFLRAGDSWELVVSDDGVGLPEGFEMTKSKGVGMRVLPALVRKLDATLSVTSASTGTAFKITYGMKAEKEPGV